MGEYAEMIEIFVDEQCDPIEGFIETIEERFDQGKTGRCKYSDIVLLMEENDWLQSDQGEIVKVIK